MGSSPAGDPVRERFAAHQELFLWEIVPPDRSIDCVFVRAGGRDHQSSLRRATSGVGFPERREHRLFHSRGNQGSAPETGSANPAGAPARTSVARPVLCLQLVAQVMVSAPRVSPAKDRMPPGIRVCLARTKAKHAPSPTASSHTWRNCHAQFCASGAILHPLRSPRSQAAPLYRPHSAPPHRAGRDSGLPERASRLDDPPFRPRRLSCPQGALMVELHLSLRCSDWFSTAATIKLQAGVATTVLLVAVRLLLRHVQVQ